MPGPKGLQLVTLGPSGIGGNSRLHSLGTLGRDSDWELQPLDPRPDELSCAGDNWRCTCYVPCMTTKSQPQLGYCSLLLPGVDPMARLAGVPSGPRSLIAGLPPVGDARSRSRCAFELARLMALAHDKPRSSTSSTGARRSASSLSSSAVASASSSAQLEDGSIPKPTCCSSRRNYAPSLSLRNCSSPFSVPILSRTWATSTSVPSSGIST